jgi:hypothetical protein
VRAPASGDFSKPRTVIVHDTAAAQPEKEAFPSPPEAQASGPAAVPVSPREAKANTDEQIIADAREAAASFTASLPTYLAQQVTSRDFSASGGGWQPIDVVTAELAYTAGKEDYRDFRIDGRRIDRPLEQTGAWSTGEFGSTLADLQLRTPRSGAVGKNRSPLARQSSMT